MARPLAPADQFRGTLEMLVLKALDGGPLHGYAIALRLERWSSDVLTLEEGSLYPALYRMEARGWLTSSWSLTESGRRARFYALTKAGRARLATEVEDWRRLSAAVKSVLSH